MSYARPMAKKAGPGKGGNCNVIPVCWSQADRVIDRFGSPGNLLKALHAIGATTTLSAIYKWRYSTEDQGCGGFIPSSNIPNIIKAARMHGILLSSEDLDPRPTPVLPFRRERKTKYHDL